MKNARQTLDCTLTHIWELPLYAFSSIEAFLSSSAASAAPSCSWVSSASAVGAPFSWAGFLAASVARPLDWEMLASSSSRRVISSLAFLMFYNL